MSVKSEVRLLACYCTVRCQIFLRKIARLRIDTEQTFRYEFKSRVLMGGGKIRGEEWPVLRNFSRPNGEYIL
jgi:hypothetical protein